MPNRALICKIDIFFLFYICELLFCCPKETFCVLPGIFLQSYIESYSPTCCLNNWWYTTLSVFSFRLIKQQVKGVTFDMRLQKYLQKYPVSTQNFSYDNRKVTHNINRYKYSKLLPFLIWIYNFFFLIKIWHRKCHEKTATLLISCWIKVPYALLHFTTERYTNKIPNIQIKKTKKKPKISL